MFAKDTYILVVDDSANIRHIICDNLRQMGFSKMEVASDGNEGFSKLVHQQKAGTPFALVLSDLNMPNLNGLEFLKQVRKSEEFKELPFVLITTESEKGAVIEAAVNGVSSYIVKPFNIETLTRRLTEAHKKHFG